MKDNLLKEIVVDSLDSGNPILFFLTEDDERVYRIIDDYFSQKNKEVLRYDPSTKFSCDEEEQYGHSFVETVSHWLKIHYLNGKQLVLRDFHKELEDINTISSLKQILRYCPNTQISIIGNVLMVPRELEHFITVIRVPLPDEKEIKEILGDELSSIPKLVELSKGLEAIDIRLISNQVVSSEQKTEKRTKLFEKKKAETVNKTGFLSIDLDERTEEELGGYHELKSWLDIAKSSIGDDTLFPKGMLLLGITGCGKSLCAKVTAKKLKLPLLKMEFGKIVNKYVGESEGNLYRAIGIAEAMSPCVLWLDEFEKAIGGNGESEVNQRMLGIFLTWMQEKKKEIFIVATVNNVSKLPAELLRRGRFDKIYYVDLPEPAERIEIIKIHAKKLGIEGLTDEEINNFSNRLQNFSGADIEGILIDAKREQKHQKTKAEIASIIDSCIKKTWPISVTLSAEIEAMRKEFTYRRFENVNKKVSKEDIDNNVGNKRKKQKNQ